MPAIIREVGVNKIISGKLFVIPKVLIKRIPNDKLRKLILNEINEIKLYRSSI